jgi:hypothetical protein
MSVAVWTALVTGLLSLVASAVTIFVQRQSTVTIAVLQRKLEFVGALQKLEEEDVAAARKCLGSLLQLTERFRDELDSLTNHPERSTSATIYSIRDEFLESHQRECATLNNYESRVCDDAKRLLERACKVAKEAETSGKALSENAIVGLSVIWRDLRDVQASFRDLRTARLRADSSAA